MFGLVRYDRVTSTKPQSFCVTVFSSGLTKRTVFLSQSHYCSYNVIRRRLTPSPLWLQELADLDAHEYAHSPDMWHQPKLANFTSPKVGDFFNLIQLFVSSKTSRQPFVMTVFAKLLYIRRVNGPAVISFWAYFTLCDRVTRVLIIFMVTARDTPARLRF